MNQEQAKSAVRWLIATFGPLIIAHGYVTSGTLELIGGAVISLIPLAWGVLVHTEANTVAVVDTIAKDPNSPVKAIIVAPTAAGKVLAASLPGDTTVVAGSTAAVAKAS